MNTYRIFGLGCTLLCIVEADCAEQALLKARAVYGSRAIGMQRI